MLHYCNDVHNLAIKQTVSSLTFLNYHDVRVPIKNMCNASSSAAIRVLKVSKHIPVFKAMIRFVLQASVHPGHDVSNLCIHLQSEWIYKCVCCRLCDVGKGLSDKEGENLLHSWSLAGRQMLIYMCLI